jgi:F-type H+-transporting ATPase subunit gamma
MKMIAAVKLKRAQSAAEEGRSYADSMERMLSGLVASLPNLDTAPKLLSGHGEVQKHLLVPITSDRGLCGGFNSNVVRETRRQIKTLVREGKDVKLLIIGRKARDGLKSGYGQLILDTMENLTRNGAEFASARDVSRRLRQMYESREFDVCSLIYNKFRSAMSQVVTAKQIIPFPLQIEEARTPSSSGHAPAAPAIQTAAYELEPDEEALLDALLPANLSMQLFHAMLESFASEQGARMTAMDSATRNAGDMISRLTLTYNRSRQAAITKELIEIVSGAEAL